MLASTFMDLVVGLDIHFEQVPPAMVPAPFPHPFMGMIWDPKGLATNLLINNTIEMAMAGELKPPKGPVLINFLPATNTGTDCKNKTVLPHFVIPPGTLWTPMPKAPKPQIGVHEMPPPDPPVAPAGDAVLMMGSKTVNIVGSNAVRFGDQAMSCSEPLRLPSSVVMAIPKGMPVIVGGPPAIDWTQAAGALLRSKWVANHLHGLVSRIKNVRLRNILSKLVCFTTGHPVDVASGRVLTWGTDWKLPGPIPLAFERNYASSWGGRDGTLGRGWSHSLDEAVWLERGRVVHRAGDGREIEFDTFDFPGHLMRKNDQVWEPINRLTLRCTGAFKWEIESAADGLVREFEQQPADNRGVLSRLVRIRSRDGHEVRLEYDRQARLEWVRDSGGRLVRFEHDRQGRLWRVALPHPTQDGWLVHTEYKYSAEGDLVAVVDPLGNTTSFEYAGHLMVRETDRNGLSFYFGYDGIGPDARCIRTWGDGGIYDHEISYDTGNHVTFVTNSLGHTTTYQANAIGCVVKVVDPLGSETQYQYDDALRVVARTDPSGSKVEYRYDARGNCILVEREGVATRYRYDACDRRVSKIDPCDRERIYERNSIGQLQSVREPDGSLTRYEYRDGRMVTHVAPDGARTGFGYDHHGNPSRIEMPSGAVVTMDYDRLGRLIRHRSTLGAKSSRSYDPLDRLVSLTDLDGSVTHFEWDAEGNLLRSETPGRRVRFGYWGKGRVAWRERGGLRASYRFDSEGEVVAILSDASEQTSLEYDAAGGLVAETSPDGARRRYQRDAMGRIVSLEKPSGVTIGFRYDPWGRKIAIAHPDGEDTYGYSPDGALVAATNADADVTLTRDLMGRLIREETGGHHVISAFGPDGLRSSLRSSVGFAQHVKRGTHRRPERITAESNGVGMEIEFERDAKGTEMARHLPGGVSIGWTRDPAGRPTERLVSRLGRTLEGESYQWTAASRIGQIVNSLRGPRRFVHDDRGYVVEATGQGGTAGGRFADPAGNVYRSPRFDDRRYGAGGKLVQDATTSYSYDLDGNLIRKRNESGEWRYSYDAFGMLKSVVRPDGNEVSFRYDALRRRIAKTSPAGETRWIWNRQQPLHEMTGSGEVSTWESSTWISAPEDGTVLGKIGKQGIEACIPDQIGTTAGLVNGAGAVSWSGDVTLYGDAVPPPPQNWPWRWPAHYKDEETGLHYNRFRYYDPESGRYLTPDPVGLLGGPNPYGYCRDPLVRFDPFGLSECGPFENKQPQDLEAELAAANRLGVSPIRPGDPGFEDLVNSGRVKWAVNEAGELVFIPHTVNGEEISHAVLTGGKPVLAAGEADIAAAGGTMIATDVTRQSGHFQPSEGSLDTGVKAFQDHGISVPPGSVNPDLER